MLLLHNRFARGLSTLGFTASPGELETLATAFADTASAGPRDTHGRPFVRWLAFSEQLETVFGPRHLESAPECDTSATSATSATATSTSAVSYKQLSQDVQRVLAAVGAAALRKRLDLTVTFADFDSMRRGRVTAAKFERALATLGVMPARAQDAAVLRRAFTVASTSTATSSALLASADEVDYRAFLSAVDTATAASAAATAAAATSDGTASGSGEWERSSVGQQWPQQPAVLDAVSKEELTQQAVQRAADQLAAHCLDLAEFIAPQVRFSICFHWSIYTVSVWFTCSK
jgi:hypothetical protein